jgi:CxxC-x17-CxxC domain-containing protein
MMDTGIEYEDREITCVDCGVPFVWEAGAQAFFRDKGLLNQPKRCVPCKKAKSERIAGAALAPGEKRRVEFHITCAQCGEQTTVPFYPSKGRPVFCRSCFLARQEDAEHLESVL